MKRLILIIVGIILLGIVLSYLNDPSKVQKSKPAPVSAQPLDIQFPKDSSLIVKNRVQKADASLASKLKSKFLFKTDEFSGETRVEHKTAPRYINNNGIYLRFYQKGQQVGGLRFCIQYLSDEWLFIDSYTFLIDGETYEYSYVDVEKDNGDGEIWEWSNEEIGPTNKRIVSALRDAKSAKIRFNGRQYYKDKKITDTQLKAIRETLDYYEALGGTW